MCQLPSVYNETLRTALKQHICCECCNYINVGERYEYVSWVWDGRGDSFKTCLVCVEIRRYAASLDGHHSCVEMGRALIFIDEYYHYGDIPLSEEEGDTEIVSAAKGRIGAMRWLCREAEIAFREKRLAELAARKAAV